MQGALVTWAGSQVSSGWGPGTWHRMACGSEHSLPRSWFWEGLLTAVGGTAGV